MATGDTASDPFSRPWPNEGEEGSLTFNRGQQNPGPPAAARQQHDKRAWPGTRPGCSESQAVNTQTGGAFHLRDRASARYMEWSTAHLGRLISRSHGPGTPALRAVAVRIPAGCCTRCDSARSSRVKLSIWE